MTAISDEFMRDMLARSRPYTVMLLTAGPEYGKDGAEEIVWEHGRRNFALRAAGTLSIVLPVVDDSAVCGIGIFNADADEVRQIMDGDPGVRAGVFTYEIHPGRGFPGDGLPG